MPRPGRRAQPTNGPCRADEAGAPGVRVRHTRAAVAAGLAAFVCLFVPRGVSRAEIADGEKAPVVTPRDFLNTQPFDFRRLLGRVVLLNVFRTTNKACRAVTSQLDELQSTYGPKGLLVVSVTSEARSAIEKFVAETKVKHAVVSEAGESVRAYDCASIPMAFLIDVEGRVAWGGHPGNLFPDVIEKALRARNDVPRLPASLAVQQRALDERRFGDARRALERVAADPKAAEADRKAAADAVAWLDAEARLRLDVALADSIRADWLAAAEGYENVEERFRGTEHAEKAAKAMKDLLADPAAKREILAARAWEDLRPKVERADMRKSIEMLRKFAADHPGTKAGAESKREADRLEALEVARKK